MTIGTLARNMAIAVALLAAPAAAATYELNYQNPNNLFSGEYFAFSYRVDIAADTTGGVNGVPVTDMQRTTTAGRMQLSATDGAGAVTNIFAYCLEIGQSLFSATGTLDSRTYTTGTYLAQNVTDRLAKLAHLAWDQVAVWDGNNSKKAAAFQLAVWEITHDSPDGDLNLTTGSFQSSAYHWFWNSNGTDSFIQQTAQTWLNTIKSVDYTGMRHMTFLHNDNSQDLWTDLPMPTDPSAVPVPAGGLLLISGLGGLAALRRRARR